MVRLISGLAYLALLGNTISAASLPESKNTLHILPEHADNAPRPADIVSPEHTLERRKGGGGRGGGGGGSGGGGRSSGGGGSRTTGSSNVGGQTSAGSGASRTFGRGGGYYGGGAAVPYSAGSRTPKGLVAAPLIGGAAVLAIMPGFWLYNSVYPYHYNNQYRFYNRSRNATDNDNNNNNNARSIVVRQEQQGVNETLPVICLCQEFVVCGCDENDDQTYIDDLIGNGSYAALNKSLVTVSDVNNTRTLVLNGTLPNGTTAPGGVDDAATGLSISRYSGYWVMGLVVLYGVML